MEACSLRAMPMVIRFTRHSSDWGFFSRILRYSAGGFVELPQQLQGNSLAEQRGFLLRLARQDLVEAFDGRLGLLLMQQADAQAELRLNALRIGAEGAAEGIRGILPAPRLLIADAQIEAGGGMVRHHG